MFPVNSLPNDKILAIYLKCIKMQGNGSELKAFTDKKFNIANMMISLCARVENIVGKGENAGDQHFLLFAQCF